MLEKRLYYIMGKDLTDHYYNMKSENTENGYLTEDGARVILEYAKKENITNAQRNALLILLFKHCRETNKYLKKKNKKNKEK